jgi:hypothetical protein
MLCNTLAAPSGILCRPALGELRCRLHQRASQRRQPTDVVAGEIELVGAHYAYHSLSPPALA